MFLVGDRGASAQPLMLTYMTFDTPWCYSLNRRYGCHPRYTATLPVRVLIFRFPSAR